MGLQVPGVSIARPGGGRVCPLESLKGSSAPLLRLVQRVPPPPWAVLSLPLRRAVICLFVFYLFAFSAKPSVRAAPRSRSRCGNVAKGKATRHGPVTDWRSALAVSSYLCGHSAYWRSAQDRCAISFNLFIL